MAEAAAQSTTAEPQGATVPSRYWSSLEALAAGAGAQVDEGGVARVLHPAPPASSEPVATSCFCPSG
eukprot:5266691-Pyramimonas_sp.AAC.1